MPPVVIYAAKSTPDEKESITTQLDACREAIERSGGREVVGEFSEENASGYKTSRGPQLAAAIQAATAAAPSELWVWHTTRLGRGTGLLGEARALGGLLYELRAAGVTVRSVDDDQFATNEVLWGIASSMSAQYSQNLSTFVKRGKQRQRERGEVLGGPCPDGYFQEKKDGKPGGPRLVDPSRAPCVRRLFELSSEHGDAAVARKLNGEGWRKRSGLPWDRRSVQAIVTSPHYGGQWTNVDGSPIAPIVEPDAWQTVQDARAARDRGGSGKPRNPVGRTTTKFVLAKLGVCGKCGLSMYAQRSPYTRKDGTSQRDYVCRNVHYDTGACDAPRIAAGPVDSAIVAQLTKYFDDFDGFVQRYASDHATQRASLERQHERLTEEATAAVKLRDKIRGRYEAALADDQDAKAEALEGVLTENTNKAVKAAAALDKVTAALAELGDAQESTNEALVWWKDLAAAVKAGLVSDSVADVNAHLIEVLQEVRMTTRDDGTVHLGVMFNAASGRGEIEPDAVPEFDADGQIVEDEDGEIVWTLGDGEGQFVPDTVDIYLPAVPRKPKTRRASTVV